MVTLESCGCQVPKFTCVICKNTYLSSVICIQKYPPPVHPCHRTNRPPKLLGPISHPIPYHRYKLCSAEHIPGTKTDIFERSIVCPKKILCSGDSGGYMCEKCKSTSIAELHYSKKSKVCPRLQCLLELTYQKN